MNLRAALFRDRPDRSREYPAAFEPPTRNSFAGRRSGRNGVKCAFSMAKRNNCCIGEPVRVKSLLS